MVIWKGWGILSLIIAVAGGVLGGFLGDQIIRLKYPTSLYPVAVGLVVAAGLNWFVGRALNKSRREAGAAVANRHSLFWIAMEWWSVVMLAAAAYLVALIVTGRA